MREYAVYNLDYQWRKIWEAFQKATRTNLCTRTMDVYRSNYFVLNLKRLLFWICLWLVINITFNMNWQWIWEYHDGTGWHPYPEENNIIKADPVSGAGSCQYYRQTCHLNRVISMEDNGRYYRCTVKRGGETAKSETIRIEKVEGR